MSSLDFDMGHVLVGFEIYDTAFSNLSFSTTDTSITFTWDLQSSTDLGNVIYGKFLTRPAAEVPLPAGAPLLFGGLALLGAVRRRSKKAS
ncbi:MAG: VPLPA-CTERM sorting domain-containing protein [Pseudooceanicola sp.]